MPCGVGYFCPTGTASATAVKCYAGVGVTAASWYRTVLTADRSNRGWDVAVAAAAAHVTMVSLSPKGAVVLANTTSGMDVSCLDSPQRLSGVLAIGGGPVRVAVVDVDGDRVGDVVAVAANGSLVVASNNGSGWLRNAVVLSTAVVAAAVVVDVDGDGDVDVMALTTTGAALLCVNNGGGGFGAGVPLTFPTVVGVSQVAVVDVDGSGGVDVIVATSSSGLRIVLATTGGAYVDDTVARVLGAPTAGATAFAMGDVDNDGDMDIAVCYGVVAPLTLLFNNGGGVYTAPPTFQPTSPVVYCTAVAFGDANNDGLIDMFVNAASGGSVLLLGGGVAAGFVFASAATWSTVGAAVFVDVNNDGVLDVPTVDYLGTATVGVGFYVRVVNRAGGLSHYGATVCLRAAVGGAVVGCRTVDGGVSGSVGQAPYDVHIGVGAGGTYNLDVSFANGRRLSATTSPSQCANVTVDNRIVVVQDVPVVAAVVLSPPSGVLKIGDAVVVTLTAAGNETGLAPWLPACCTVGGVNVSGGCGGRKGVGVQILQSAITRTCF